MIIFPWRESFHAFSDFEVVVADNGSTNRTLEAAMSDDPRFRAFRLGANPGPIRTRPVH